MPTPSATSTDPVETAAAAEGQDPAVVPDDPPAAPARPRPVLLEWAPAPLLVAAAVAAHVVLARHMRTPIIHADEFGYLMGAHFMARGGSPIGAPYFPGYSALLVPLWWLSRDPTTVYRWALDVNAGLAGATILLLYFLARRLAPRAGPLRWAAAAVAVAAYPAVVLYSQLAESENLLLPGFLVVCLLVLRAVERPTARRWGGAALAAGLLYAVHGRALAAVAALVLTAAWVLRPWTRHRRALLAAAAAVLFSLGVSELGIHWVTRSVPGRQLPPSTSGSPGLVSRVTTGSGLGHVGVILAGQGLYLMAAAGGLVALGVAVLWRAARRPAEDRAERGWGTFLLLSLLAVAVVSAVFLATGSRIDNAVYGRYVEVFAVPVLLVGAVRALGLHRRDEPGPRALVVTVGAAIAAGAFGAGVLVYWGSTIHGTVVRTNAFGMADLFWGPDTAARLSVGIAIAVAAGAAVVVLGTFRLASLVGVVAVVGVFVAPTVRAYGDVVDQSSAALQARVVPGALAALQKDFGPLRCVAWDGTLPNAWDFYNTRLLEPDMVFPVFDPSRGQVPGCATGLAVASRNLDRHAAYAGARLVLLGNDAQTLWSLPGPLQDRLDRAGRLLPAGFPGPLPASAADGSISLVPGTVPTGPLSMAPEGAIDLRLRVTHGPTGPAWPDAPSLGPVPNFAVRVGVAWYRGPVTPSDVVAAARADLTAPLLPGRSTVVPLRLAPLGIGSTVTVPRYLPPGAYLVRISLIQEGAGNWDATIPPVSLQVTVRAR